MSILRVEKVVKAFDGFVAVDRADLTVEQGMLCSIIGPNGAGKSTLFNLISGELFPDSGRIDFKGEDITQAKPYQVCHKGIGRSFQRTRIFPRLTVFENVQAAVITHQGRGLNLFTPAKNMARDETYALLENVGLADRTDTLGGELAHGEQKQLELGIVLAGEPELLLLDEPTSGMSPEETVNAINLIGKIARQRQLTLLFTEHDMDVVFSISERITVMHQGRVIAEGTPEEVRASDEVQRVYLGELD